MQSLILLSNIHQALYAVMLIARKTAVFQVYIQLAVKFHSQISRDFSNVIHLAAGRICQPFLAPESPFSALLPFAHFLYDHIYSYVALGVDVVDKTRIHICTVPVLFVRVPILLYKSSSVSYFSGQVDHRAVRGWKLNRRPFRPRISRLGSFLRFH